MISPYTCQDGYKESESGKCGKDMEESVPFYTCSGNVRIQPLGQTIGGPQKLKLEWPIQFLRYWLYIQRQ